MITRPDQSRLDRWWGVDEPVASQPEPKSIGYRTATKLVAGIAVAAGIALIAAALIAGYVIGTSGEPDAWVGAAIAATGIGTSIMFLGLGFALLWAVTVDEERDQ